MNQKGFGPESSSREVFWPIFLVSMLVVFQAGFTNVLQVLTHASIYPVVGFAFGGDYQAFSWQGAKAFVNNCPWTDRATHPPFFKQILSSLPLFPQPTGAVNFFWANIFCIFSSSAVATYMFFPRRRWWPIAAISGAALLSYPVLMLLDRGNIDAWVIFFALLGFFAISRNNFFLAGALIACSIASKVYPAVLLAPLVLQLQLRTLVWMALSFVGIYLCAPEAWQCFISSVLVGRLQQIAGYENGSLLVSLAGLLKLPFDHPEVNINFMIAGISVIVANALLDVVSNSRKVSPRDRAAWLLLYLPLMIAFPKTVYHYCLWCLLLLPFAYAYILSRTSSHVIKALVFVCCLGVAASQLQAISLNLIQEAGWGTRYYRLDFIPGLGSSFVLFAHIPLKLFWLLQMPAKATGVGNEEVGANPDGIFSALLGKIRDLVKVYIPGRR